MGIIKFTLTGLLLEQFTPDTLNQRFKQWIQKGITALYAVIRVGKDLHIVQPKLLQIFTMKIFLE